MTHLPPKSGVSLKAQHYQTILETTPDIGWFEVHPENYMGEGGLPHRFLTEIRAQYALSMHGVGLSLGSADGIDAEHLAALTAVVDRYQPEQVSEHLAWSHWNATFLNDLLPVPYTKAFLNVVAENIERVQNALKRTILIENPSVYLGFKNADFTETDFLRQLTQRTGCGLLLDVNNVFVSAQNLKTDANDYLINYPIDAIGEVHLAGHAVQMIGEDTVCIDDHGSPVTDSVWALFEQLLTQMNSPPPTLVEWDTDVPDFNVLKAEADQAQAMLESVFQEPNLKEVAQ